MKNIRIGVVGSGFISKHIVLLLQNFKEYSISKVLTGRIIEHCVDYPSPELLTNSVQQLIDESDVIVECSGHVIKATDLIDVITKAGKPVVTYDSTFHITAGSYFVDRGLVTECEGDQPGSLAALKEEVLNMGFEPLSYMSIKGYLNPDPKQEDMEYWSAKQGISVPMTVSFTDGTKLAIEQALVANGLGAIIPSSGMFGPAEDMLHNAADFFGAKALELKTPLSDYILSSKQPHGIFIVARHNQCQKAALQYVKAGCGPYYFILKHTIFAHLEVIKTVKRILNKQILLDNSNHPSTSVAAFAKHDLKVGEKIACGAGSFSIRGSTVSIKENSGHLPIGLLYNATILRPIQKGQMLTLNDVDIEDNLALKAWRETEDRVLQKLILEMADIAV